MKGGVKMERKAIGLLGITLMLFLVAGVIASGFSLASAVAVDANVVNTANVRGAIGVNARNAVAVKGPVTIRAIDNPEADVNVVATTAKSAFVSPVSVSAIGNTKATVSTRVGGIVPIIKADANAAGTVPNVKSVQLQAAGPAVYVKATAVKKLFLGFIPVSENSKLPGTKVVYLQVTDSEKGDVSEVRVKQAAAVQVSGYNVAVKSAASVDNIQIEVSAVN